MSAMLKDSSARTDLRISVASDPHRPESTLRSREHALQTPASHGRQSRSFPSPPKYLLYRALEPPGPYIVGTWRVRVSWKSLGLKSPKAKKSEEIGLLQSRLRALGGVLQEPPQALAFYNPTPPRYLLYRVLEPLGPYVYSRYLEG